MGHIRLSGNPPIEISLRRSARARRLSLRVSQLDGRVTLTLPRTVTDSEGLAFVHDKESWLRGHLEKQGGPLDIGLGACLPVEGVVHRVAPGTGRSVSCQDGLLLVPGEDDRVPARLRGWLKARARDRLSQAADLYAARLGRPYRRLTLRDTRSRWGSCTHDGGLMFSWRLILADSRVLEYVAAHEVAHLAQMNHSPAFWAQCEALYGDWRPARRWLHEHGHELHRYRFE